MQKQRALRWRHRALLCPAIGRASSPVPGRAQGPALTRPRAKVKGPASKRAGLRRRGGPEAARPPRLPRHGAAGSAAALVGLAAMAAAAAAAAACLPADWTDCFPADWAARLLRSLALSGSRLNAAPSIWPARPPHRAPTAVRIQLPQSSECALLAPTAVRIQLPLPELGMRLGAHTQPQRLCPCSQSIIPATDESTPRSIVTSSAPGWRGLTPA